jgi:ketosteroid isomerase-like protein
MSKPTDVVRRLLAAYRDQDVETAEALLADDLTFTSPQDDRIDKSTYLARCFPTADRFVANDLREVVEVAPGLVFLRYVYELRDGGVFSNTEVITVRETQITDIQVYFGGATTMIDSP